MSNATVQAHAQTLALGLDVVHEPAANGKEVGQTCANRTSYACATRTTCPEYPQISTDGLGVWCDTRSLMQIHGKIPCNSQPSTLPRPIGPSDFLDGERLHPLDPLIHQAPTQKKKKHPPTVHESKPTPNLRPKISVSSRWVDFDQDL